MKQPGTMNLTPVEALNYDSAVRSNTLSDTSNPSIGRGRITAVRFSRGAMALVPFVLFCAAAGVCRAQEHEVVCNEGDGIFETVFRTGVKVHVGAARNGELAIRACEAELSWNKQKLKISDSASQIDVDALGIDLGLGAPVVTIQVRKSDADCCMEYRVYSLQKPPRLLRTITGGSFFAAADTDLDGHVEIWTDDSASVDGFEGFNVVQEEFAPAIVLRFVKGKLLDVSSEFQDYFDREITKVRASLDAQEIRDFKSSDGQLTQTGVSSLDEKRHNEHLRSIKLKVLEIVWSYVYSGREEQAWRSLADMWPAADVGRIHAAILKAHDNGVRAQVDGVSQGVAKSKKEHAMIYDGVTTKPGNALGAVPPGQRGRATPFGGASSPDVSKPDLVPPDAIQVWLPPSMEKSEPVALDLVIDSAGKVRSAEVAGGPKGAYADLILATAEWKFVPAFKYERPVAIRVRMPVSPKR